MSWSPESVLEVDDDLVYAEHQGVVYLVPPWATVVRLNATASSLWVAIQETDSLGAAAALWATRMSVETERAEEFLDTLVDSLVRRDLVRVT